MYGWIALDTISLFITSFIVLFIVFECEDITGEVTGWGGGVAEKISSCECCGT